MFKVKIDKIDLLRDSLGTVAELIDEAELHLKKDKINIIASDRAVVAVANFSILSKAFKKYECKKEEKIGVNLPHLLDILKRARGDDIVDIELREKQLFITMENGSTRNFVLPLIDISREETPPIDKLNFPVSIKLKTDVLDNGISDADLITDSIVFNVDNETVSLRAESDNRVAEMLLTKKSPGLIKLDGSEKIKARYSLDYLKKMIKAKKITDKVTLSMANDYPMKLTFEVPDKLSLDFILAPRVEEG